MHPKEFQHIIDDLIWKYYNNIRRLAYKCNNTYAFWLVDKKTCI
jgi:hypothetical protein